MLRWMPQKPGAYQEPNDGRSIPSVASAARPRRVEGTHGSASTPCAASSSALIAVVDGQQ